MTLAPTTLADLSAQLAAAHAARRPITTVDLAALAAVREYTPEDMTITAEGGLTLAALQATLAVHGQWLPIDPPHPDRITLRQLLAENLFGPQRCGFGTIREHLIGLEAVLPDGRVTHSGGKVVKNVAGYDLLKLFVGARDSLGIISAATFKLRPLPEQHILLTAQFPTLTTAWAAVETLLASPLTPVSLDLHNLAPDGTASNTLTLVLGLAGTRAEVEWQRTRATGFSLSLHQVRGEDRGEGLSAAAQVASPLIRPAATFSPPPRKGEGEVGGSHSVSEQTAPSLSLHQMRGEGRGEGLSAAAPDPEQAFWNSPHPVQTLSVLPSSLPEALAHLGPTPFIARAANGIIHYRGFALPVASPPPSGLTARLKATFDPHGILPAAPM